MIPSVDEFEKLGVFYLGRKYDLGAGALQDELLLYDAKDLCTHALCVGMTGSGKTGLCLALLEEAAIDAVPVICIDPKGDLGNLLLSFPNLESNDFLPWVDESEAMRQGKTRAEFAESTAKLWKDGLALWGQSPDRIQTLKDAADVTIYTPGSSAGIPLTVLRSFDAPSQAVLNDSDAYRERISGAASGLLTLLGLEADPLLAREHILVSSILDHCWQKGQSLQIADMIALIQTPPFQKVGVLDLDTFMPPTERVTLAMRLNNLLASPAFSSWLEGESLDIQQLMYTSAGKPRISIISIAHLSDAERMFFVTIFLNELVAWMRSQSGTSSLRAIFYMDEVFGYFPPTAKPPSKQPMLTLLKQARAFGLGVVLATQNPVDLDYKGLSNIGTWFLGRLQTERDKQRVLEGLEGAAAQQGQRFDRQEMEQILAGLGKRVFLMNNVHDDGPTIFQSRWAMSYLAGPLARDQISQLMQQRKSAHKAAIATNQSKSTRGDQSRIGTEIGGIQIVSHPMIPAGIKEQYIVPNRVASTDCRSVYRPALYCQCAVHYVRTPANVDVWHDLRRMVDCASGITKEPWEASDEVLSTALITSEADPQFEFLALPVEMQSSGNFIKWSKAFKEYVYRHQTLVIYKSPALNEYAAAGLSQDEARLSFAQRAREERDRETEKLRLKYSAKMETLDRRIREAQQRLAREKGELNQMSITSVVDIGSSLLGSLLGNKRKSRSSGAQVVKRATRAANQHQDVRRAEEVLQELSRDLLDLDNELRDRIAKVSEQYAIENLTVEKIEIPARKNDLRSTKPMVLWTPWQIDTQNQFYPLF